MSRPILQSGGAEGADSYFGACAQAAGHQVHHYSFQGHQSTCEHRVILTESQLEIARPYITWVAPKLQKQVPTSAYVRRLIFRNFYQVWGANQLIAVAPLQSATQVKGGTGWAVEMAKEWKLPLYVFDEKSDAWFSFDYSIQRFEPCNLPPLTPCYAGVGSRALGVKGKNAIRSLYEYWANEV